MGDENVPRMRVGLVLGAGGVLGGAWLTGGLAALAQETEWDPSGAEYIVGTSAGSMIGALVAAGVPPWFMVAHSLDLVICLNPMSSSFGPAVLEPLDWVAATSRRSGARRLAHEERKLRRFGTEVLTIEPTRDDHAAMGRNWMSAARRRQVIETAERTVIERLRRPKAQELLRGLPPGEPHKVRRPEGPPSTWPLPATPAHRAA